VFVNNKDLYIIYWHIYNFLVTRYTIELMHYSHFKTQSLQHLKPNKMLKTCL